MLCRLAWLTHLVLDLVQHAELTRKSLEAIQSYYEKLIRQVSWGTSGHALLRCSPVGVDSSCVLVRVQCEFSVEAARRSQEEEDRKAGIEPSGLTGMEDLILDDVCVSLRVLGHSSAFLVDLGW